MYAYHGQAQHELPIQDHCMPEKVKRTRISEDEENEKKERKAGTPTPQTLPTCQTLVDIAMQAKSHSIEQTS